MTKTAIDKPLYLDIHSLIKVSSHPMPDEISRYTREKLSLFLTNAPITEGESDIVISKIEPHYSFGWTDYHFNLEYGFRITEYKGETAVIFAHRARPDVVVILSDPIRIFYVERQGISDKLYDALVFCLQITLLKRGGLFFHGAVAKREGSTVLLAGPFGSKKSMLLLTMLRDNWNFISDDKFILHGGNAYMLNPIIMLRDYYLEFLPWLEDIVPDVKKFKKAEAYRALIRKFAVRHLPASFFPLLRKFYDPFVPVNINVSALFPAFKTIMSARISVVVLLSAGPELKVTEVPRSDILEDLAAVQRLINYEELRFSLLKEQLFLQEKTFRCTIDDIIDGNFNDQVFFKLTLPINCDMNLAYLELNRCLVQAH